MVSQGTGEVEGQKLPLGIVNLIPQSEAVTKSKRRAPGKARPATCNVPGGWTAGSERGRTAQLTESGAQTTDSLAGGVSALELGDPGANSRSRVRAPGGPDSRALLCVFCPGPGATEITQTLSQRGA